MFVRPSAKQSTDIPEVRLGTLSEKDARHKIKLLGATFFCSRQDVAGEERDGRSTCRAVIRLRYNVHVQDSSHICK